MNTLRLHAAGDLRRHDEPVPVPASGEQLVRVGAVGICGSDLHWFTEGGIGDARLDVPLVLGHEIAGTIEGGPRHGQRVAIDPAIPCEHCKTCRSGDRNLCPTVRFAGHGETDGGLRDYLAWPARLLPDLPDEVSLVDAAMLEPLGVALHATDLAHLRPDATVAVVGCGPIGLLALQLVRVAGARRVVAVEPLAHRRDAATRLGADVALHPEDATDQMLLDVTEGRGADVVLEVAGTDAAVDISLRASRPGARVMLTGIPDDGTTTFVAGTARRRGLTLVLVRRMKDTYPRAIDLVARGVVDVRSIVSHRVSLDDAAAGFALAAARDGLKVVVCPTPAAGQ
jgi:L-iditol 2-dehydrogenase